jgi:Uma2 family endonuclease
VAEYWIVNPKGHTVEVYALQEGEYALSGEVGGDEAAGSPLFGALPFTAGELFER